MVARLITAPRAQLRIDAATDWLTARGRSSRVAVLAPQRDAAADLVRRASIRVGGAFGWRSTTLDFLARELARTTLVASGLAPASSLAIEAVCARVVTEAADDELQRFTPVADTPGLPRALARTLSELRLADVPAARLPPALGRLSARYDRALAECGLADVAAVLRAGIAAAAAAPEVAMLLLDVAPKTTLHQRFVAALAARSTDLLATAPTGDGSAVARLETALEVAAEPIPFTGADALGSLQEHLFADQAPAAAGPGPSVVVLSAPGEGRESVEIARRIHRAADEGVPFDRIAVLTRSPELYRAHLQEALRRAGVPAWFDRGARRPDLGGRALLALLRCRAEGLSAHRFSEYLSLGEVPDAAPTGAPPPPIPAGERFVPPDDDSDAEAPAVPEDASDPPDAATRPVYRGTLRVPRRWEKLLVESAVIGGLDRWTRRLDGLHAQLQTGLHGLEEGDPYAAIMERKLREVDQLRAFALPLLRDLDALPERATWGEWLDRLGALASRAVRSPDRVESLLRALQPMADSGPVDLSEVRRVLEHRLTDLVEYPSGRRFGRVFVGPAEAARGRSFDVVFVPGLAERLFPRKVVEDPLLLDAERAATGGDLELGRHRVEAERLRLRLAAGAATKRLVLSWSRIDAAQSRPRVPSFYGLEVVRATEGRLPGFAELGERADAEGGSRIAWPAPEDPAVAIDSAEHDLALFRAVRRKTQGDAAGTMRYLLSVNPFLARSLRARYARWSLNRLHSYDGLVAPCDQARSAMKRHTLDQRSFSATALQDFASCPYRFFLRTVMRLSPREEPEAIEYLDPLSRGSLIHDTQFEVLTELRATGRLPLTALNLGEARDILDATLDVVADNYAEELCPAIPRVWNDELASIRTDLREWLRLLADDTAWVPYRFELAFGLKHHTEGRDEHSQDEPVHLDCGIRLRGAIDMVEQARTGELRVTDHKTGRARYRQGVIVSGGSALQPVLYALAAEKLFPDLDVGEGRLWYCTTNGGFQVTSVRLDDKARRAADVLSQTVRARMAKPELPAAPAEGACRWCDYATVCGPHEELRTGSKSAAALKDLVTLRTLR